MQSIKKSNDRRILLQGFDGSSSSRQVTMGRKSC
jgi:hypothetical protein